MTKEYVTYSIDLSQAENRIVAYEANCKKMMEAFETGVDVHSLTASGIFKKPPSEISNEEDIKTGRKKPCSLGDGKHDERFWGKKGNHSSNYDIGIDELALKLEITRNQAAFILSGYHEMYPEVQKNYQAEVRQKIMYDKTLTNLMGRNTVFLGKVCNSLFKEAYSCIPQGTVGDIINERGLNYVYYNEELFPTVELLAQTHDEIIFQLPLTNWKEHVRVLTLIKTNLETPLTTTDGLRTFVIPADITIMRRFKCGKKVKKLDTVTLETLWEDLKNNQ